MENEGGLAAVINSTNIAKHGPAQKLIASLEGSTSKDSIFDTLNNKVTDGVFTSLADAIDTLCGDEKLMAGDIVSSRTACNLAIVRAMSTTTGIYGNSLSVMKDVYAAFEDYKDLTSYLLYLYKILKNFKYIIK